MITAAKSIRNSRTVLLKDSDWTALHDVPTQAGFPWTITWPESP